ncbi:hypothetical protein SISSUDRAFT_415205 [Sistotremastrum suecicum HHB10207 ss-3]|uniref:Uncharacterized protein n=1 Tax=Sistotremastrum suecicum HHB10207 ss-3 TaxID=1314776 RepID=A0A166FPE3_9AGAM|nr:hypothetical protein SISSUDRAFT_415205 [Sistotremastrum suecicum HHB10207 ss-3]
MHREYFARWHTDQAPVDPPSHPWSCPTPTWDCALPTAGSRKRDSRNLDLARVHDRQGGRGAEDRNWTWSCQSHVGMSGPRWSRKPIVRHVLVVGAAKAVVTLTSQRLVSSVMDMDSYSSLRQFPERTARRKDYSRSATPGVVLTSKMSSQAMTFHSFATVKVKQPQVMPKITVRDVLDWVVDWVWPKAGLTNTTLRLHWSQELVEEANLAAVDYEAQVAPRKKLWLMKELMDQRMDQGDRDREKPLSREVALLTKLEAPAAVPV